MCEKKGGDVRRLYTASLPYRTRCVMDFMVGREGKMMKRSEGTKRRGRGSRDTKGQRDTEGALEIRRDTEGALEVRDEAWREKTKTSTQGRLVGNAALIRCKTMLLIHGAVCACLHEYVGMKGRDTDKVTKELNGKD